jgi:hypothetical protein
VFPSILDFVVARERRLNLRHGVGSDRLLDDGATPVTRVTLRWAGAADRVGLGVLAELDSAEAPCGPTLVAEVDGRLRAALPLDGSAPLADPFHRGSELIELLRLRAWQLRRAGA